jgi:hypothetical protein
MRSKTSTCDLLTHLQDVTITSVQNRQPQTGESLVLSMKSRPVYHDDRGKAVF